MSEIKNPFLDDDEKQYINKENDTMKVSKSVNAESNLDDDAVGSLEIKEDGKILKNIIILMIVLLILALLALAGYRLFNKSDNNPIKNINQQKNINTGDNNFEMNGQRFKANSIVIE